MAVLASPDVGVRGRALLKNRRIDTQRTNMTASTVAQYLAALPADRRAALSAVRKVINENLPDGYEEGMQFGMIGWYVPLSMYPAGYGEKGVLNRTHTELDRCYPLSQPGSPANTRRAAGSSTWVKVASASNRWRTWLSTGSAAPLRACPWRSTWPITRRRGRSWAARRGECWENASQCEELTAIFVTILKRAKTS